MKCELITVRHSLVNCQSGIPAHELRHFAQRRPQPPLGQIVQTVVTLAVHTLSRRQLREEISRRINGERCTGKVGEVAGDNGVQAVGLRAGHLHGVLIVLQRQRQSSAQAVVINRADPEFSQQSDQGERIAAQNS